MIDLQHVEVVFGAGTAFERVALRRMNLHIGEGDFITVVGSNGAGKSTLLGVLAAAVRATSGKVLIDGQDVSRQTEVERAALVARVFQDPLSGTCATMTIQENLALAAMRGRRRGFALSPRRSDRQRFAELLQPLGLGLEHRLKSQMGLLSGGQRQAVSLLMASLSGSRLLLLDEHTAALDPATAELVLKITKRIIEKGRLTTLMVTHSMEQALALGSRIVMLDQGTVVFDAVGPERDRLSVTDMLAKFPVTGTGIERPSNALSH